ncbi:MAG TPA: right-handed parallel beta-helix repeat-containing protein, partial [Prolixibacteraceae bacterium]
MQKRFFTFLLIMLFSSLQWLSAQRGYYDAPYQRYEADQATLSNGALVTSKSYAQADLQSEASDQVCVDMNSTDATLEFALSSSANGLVIRYSVPDGQSAVVGVYDGNTKITSLTLSSKWSWESLWNNGDPNNVGITNKNPKMRFDEVRYLLPNSLSRIKLIKESGNLSLDFIEMEPVAAALTAPAGAAVFSGDGSTLQAFIDVNGGKTIFVPAGVYNINSQLYFGVANTKLQGAGMWYTQINFTVTDVSNGGLRGNAPGISYADLYITTAMTTRTKGYGGIIGVYTQGSTIKNVWVEHCATGAWIGQYTTVGPVFADGFVMSDCRFRNTYADGINLCKGTSNAIVEHCNFRNNGDDGMAIWSAEGLECINNT